tara:strand:+ start:795 stop:1154 length:360 start_codon:yes stop_codon:yes gene_type:complete
MLVLGKFLYFAKGTSPPNAVGESILYPAESFEGAEPTGNTTLRLYFSPRITSSFVEDEYEKVDLTITSIKHKEVMDSIIAEINSGSRDGGFITVADTPNSIFLNPNIISVADIILTTAT